MEARRLVIERVERLRELRVRDQFCEASGKMREFVEITEVLILAWSSAVMLQLEFEAVRTVALRKE